jgi:hypothetical protein
VEDDPGSWNDDAGTEHVGNACDQGNSIAIAIDDREVRRVSIDSARRRIIERTVWLDQAATPAEVVCREETLHGCLDKARIGDAPCRIGKAQLMASMIKWLA